MTPFGNIVLDMRIKEEPQPVPGITKEKKIYEQVWQFSLFFQY